MKKIPALLGSAFLFSSISAHALEVTAIAPGGEGIGYEFEVHMDQNETAYLVGVVGAKSSYEPDFQAPNIGWTHFSNWTALMIHQPSLVTITVKNKSGVVRTVLNDEGALSTSVAGDELYPGISLYNGWDKTTQAKHSFNSIGNFWATVEHITSAGDMDGNHTETMNVLLGPGKYSVNFGGVNALHCSTEDTCYNGVHGYSAMISTSPLPISYGMDSMN